MGKKNKQKWGDWNLRLLQRYVKTTDKLINFDAPDLVEKNLGLEKCKNIQASDIKSFYVDVVTV